MYGWLLATVVQRVATCTLSFPFVFPAQRLNSPPQNAGGPLMSLSPIYHHYCQRTDGATRSSNVIQNTHAHTRTRKYIILPSIRYSRICLLWKRQLENFAQENVGQFNFWLSSVCYWLVSFTTAPPTVSFIEQICVYLFIQMGQITKRTVWQIKGNKKKQTSLTCC